MSKAPEFQLASLVFDGDGRMAAALTRAADLHAQAVTVYLTLRSFGHFKDDVTVTRKGQRLIAQRLGWPDHKRVGAALRALESAGLVVAQKDTGRRTVYQVFGRLEVGRAITPHSDANEVGRHRAPRTSTPSSTKPINDTESFATEEHHARAVQPGRTGQAPRTPTSDPPVSRSPSDAGSFGVLLQRILGHTGSASARRPGPTSADGASAEGRP